MITKLEMLQVILLKFENLTANQATKVRAWDVRDVSDQVHSMGAKWVTVDFKESGEGQGKAKLGK